MTAEDEPSAARVEGRSRTGDRCQPAPTVGVSDLASFLTGYWRLRRTLFLAEDASSAADSDDGCAQLINTGSGVPDGWFEGTATVWPDTDEARLLHYREEGTLRMNGGSARPAYRQLRYVLLDGAHARVEFDDGRYFHELDLSTGNWRAEHPCGADRYVGRFGVVSADLWWQLWTVHGPRKAHVVQTWFERRFSDLLAASASGATDGQA